MNKNAWRNLRDDATGLAVIAGLAYLAFSSVSSFFPHEHEKGDAEKILAPYKLNNIHIINGSADCPTIQSRRLPPYYKSSFQAINSDGKITRGKICGNTVQDSIVILNP